jgi:hypothetical protein
MRSETVRVRVSPDEKALILAEAARAQRSVSDFIRLRVLGEVVQNGAGAVPAGDGSESGRSAWQERLAENAAARGSR